MEKKLNIDFRINPEVVNELDKAERFAMHKHAKNTASMLKLKNVGDRGKIDKFIEEEPTYMKMKSKRLKESELKYLHVKPEM